MSSPTPHQSPASPLSMGLLPRPKPVAEARSSGWSEARRVAGLCRIHVGHAASLPSTTLVRTERHSRQAACSTIGRAERILQNPAREQEHLWRPAPRETRADDGWGARRDLALYPRDKLDTTLTPKWAPEPPSALPASRATDPTATLCTQYRERSAAGPTAQFRLELPPRSG